jgi:hypothetical protein
MKVTRHLARLEPLVLGPLHGLQNGDWHRAPDGEWTIAQIVEHLAISVDSVATIFHEREDVEGMQRRSKPHQAVMRHLALGARRVPAGFKAVVGVEPSPQPDPDLVSAEFRMAVEMLKTFAEDWPLERQAGIYVGHPTLGDLNLPEWARFHYLHCRHHARHIRERLAWMGKP